MRYIRSSALFSEAQQFIPGGVNSPVRAFGAVGGSPVFIKRAEKSYLYDEDNNRYIDYISSWGPLIYGHAYPPVVDAVKSRVQSGTSFGAPTKVETDIAQLLVSVIPNVDKVRFVNSGTEACMSAIRLARGFTGREKFIKFEGCYHGHSDSFLIQAGSGAVTFETPNSPGITQGTAKDTLLAKFNDLSSVRRLFEANENTIAAVIVEPVAGNMGCIPPEEGFLQGLRNLCDHHGALLIFDEVMTGLRLALGGAQETESIKADIVTLGKIIGGGLPVGAFAAHDDIMDHLAPEGSVYQAGTLSGNPLAMSAGLAMITALYSDRATYKRLKEKTAYLADAFGTILRKSKISYHINHYGSMISVHFTPFRVVDFQTAMSGNNEMFKKFFHGMLQEGIYLPPSAFESWFLNDALTQDDLDKTITAFDRVIKTLN